MKPIVLCTSPTFGKYSRRAEEMLAEAGLALERVSPAEARDPGVMREKLKNATALIAGAFKVPREVMAAAPHLAVMTKHGTGTDHFDLDAARELDVVVANAPGLNADAVADLALGLMLAVARRIPFSDRGARRGEWKPVMGVELSGKTLGVVGMGAIGKGLIRRAAGFDMSFAAFDPVRDEACIAAHDIRMFTDVAELAGVCDFLSIHVPLNSDTRGMFDDAMFAAMKPSAILINTSRGGVVNEAALVRALADGRIAGAGLDVLAAEPPAPDNPLLASDRVVVTQHMGAYTEEAMAAISEVCAENVIRVVRGEEPLYRVV